MCIHVCISLSLSIYIYIYIYLSMSLSQYMYIYIYIYMCVSLSLSIYIYIYSFLLIIGNIYVCNSGRHPPQRGAGGLQRPGGRAGRPGPARESVGRFLAARST